MANQITFYASPIRVKVSSGQNNFVTGNIGGSLKTLSGIVPNVGLLGVNTGVVATTSTNGLYSINNLPYGSGSLKANDFRYEPYINRYISSSTPNVINQNIYTNLKTDTAIPTVSSLFVVGETDGIFENKEKEIIQYTVSDDIGNGSVGIVQSVTLYYWNPQNDSWNLIGIDSGYLSGTRTFEWNVPANLVGSGYKIKAIAKDFSNKVEGNASGEISFVENYLATTSVAKHHTIKWVDNDEDSNAVVTFSYDIDKNSNNGNHIKIDSVEEDDPTNEYEWKIGNEVPNAVYMRADISDMVNSTTTIYSETQIIISHLDVIPPEDGSMTFNSRQGTVYIPGVTTRLPIVLSITDDDSGMGIGAMMQFSLDNITWTTLEQYAIKKYFDVTYLRNHDVLYGRFKDVAGNMSNNYTASIPRRLANGE
jgi:hypothetical protein